MEFVYHVMMSRCMHITLSQGLVLTFDLVKSPIADVWLERMSHRHHWPLDDPARFYGFGTAESERSRAQRQILQCIDTINRHDAIVTRPFTSVQDQDYLNYLHHIFEVYHGLLDQQHSEWWQAAPDAVRQALANLNIAVHRCESLRSNRPRFVCTWFGMPKTQRLSHDVMIQHGQLNIDFGGVYLNYVEIGKTLLDLATDGDQYIDDDAFRPFDHYSADFVVYFFQDDQRLAVEKVRSYYQQHREFFSSRGIQHSDDHRVLPLKFKVAQLRYESPDIIQHIGNQLMIKSIEIS